MLNNQSIIDSKFLTIHIAQNDAACRAASTWRVGIITRGAASASMDEESASAAHLIGFLRGQIKGTGSLDSLVHVVYASVQFVCTRG
jgi:hypothetical protein